VASRSQSSSSLKPLRWEAVWPKRRVADVVNHSQGSSHLDSDSLKRVGASWLCHGGSKSLTLAGVGFYLAFCSNRRGQKDGRAFVLALAFTGFG
jgi:hypothetical protein